MSHANQVNQTPAPSIHLIHVTIGALDIFYLLTGELGTELFTSVQSRTSMLYFDLWVQFERDRLSSFSRTS